MTGVKKRSLQIKWLEEHRIPFTLPHGKRSKPNVLVALVEKAHGLKQTTAPRSNERNTPNMEAFP